MKREIRNKPASIRARLMNIARAEGVDFDALLLRYFQERFLYRLSISEFSDHLVLKGGLLLICLKMPKSRPTKDIDFLAEQVKNDPVELENILREIVEISCDDGVRFNTSSVTSERIKEDADYEGIRLKVDATLGQARKRLQMDIGFGDIIIPEAKLMDFPTLLEEKPPKFKVYSIESIISEKFEAMVKLAVVNSRMSDNPLAFRPEFHKDKGRQKQWIAFLRKSRLSDVNQEFSEIMERITIFLRLIVISIKDRTRVDKSWDFATGCWKK